MTAALNTGARRHVPAGSGPRWQRLAADLRGRLAAGDFADVFPGELALAESYRVSRATVREALRSLRREGLVTAHRGRPSRAMAPTVIEQSTQSLFSLFSTVEAAGMSQRSVVRALEVRTDALVAAQLQLQPDAELIYLERIRFAGDQPLALDSTFLPATHARCLLDADFSQTSLYGLLRTRCGIAVTSGREKVRAAVPDDEVRAALCIGRDVAVLLIERIGFADMTPVEYRHTVLRGDLFTLTNHYPVGES